MDWRKYLHRIPIRSCLRCKWNRDRHSLGRYSLKRLRCDPIRR